MNTDNVKEVLLKKCVEESFNYAKSGPMDGQEHWYEKNMKKEFKDIYQMYQLKTGVGL